MGTSVYDIKKTKEEIKLIDKVMGDLGRSATNLTGDERDAHKQRINFLVEKRRELRKKLKALLDAPYKEDRKRRRQKKVDEKYMKRAR